MVVTELNANDVHKIAWDIQHLEKQELVDVMSKIRQAAYDGKFTVRVESIISDPVLLILSIKGFTWDDNRKYRWSDPTKPTVDIYWTKPEETK